MVPVTRANGPDLYSLLFHLFFLLLIGGPVVALILFIGGLLDFVGRAIHLASALIDALRLKTHDATPVITEERRRGAGWRKVRFSPDINTALGRKQRYRAKHLRKKTFKKFRVTTLISR